MLKRFAIGPIAAFLLPCNALAQATQPTDDAARLYMQAGDIVIKNNDANIMSPANSNSVFTGYPPSSREWLAMEKADFAATAEVRAIAHQARSVNVANWPPLVGLKPNLQYLNVVRALANELGDAALYEHAQGDDAAAFETLGDLQHLAVLVANPADKKVVCLLVSVGIRALMLDRLDVIASGVHLTKDPADTRAVQATVIKAWITDLLSHPDAKSQAEEYVRAETKQGQQAPVLGEPLDKTAREKFIQSCQRAYTECDLSAMSLACHLYQFDHGYWPARLDDLHAYLQSVPLDPWGDGKQTLGYALIKAGLPDGSDRPLVYSRHTLEGALFFRTDQPFYSYYSGDGSNRPWHLQRHGGQFRDVTAWAPPTTVHATATPTTQPLD